MIIPTNLTQTGNGYDDEVTPLTGMNFTYGTTGFRMNYKYMPCLAFRLAINSCLHTLTASVNIGKSVHSGMMITASHNVCTDNGIKAYAPKGDYYTPEDIKEVTRIVNLFDDDFEKEIEIIQKRKHELEEKLLLNNVQSHITIGYDTRKSSKYLCDYVLKGIEFFNSSFIVVHVINKPVTTPLHQFVLKSDIDLMKEDVNDFIEKYANDLGKRLTSISGTDAVLVDCANGVGSIWTKSYFGDNMPLKIQPVNIDYQDFEKLNFDCGADYVKTTGKIPVSSDIIQPNQRIASLDGDADRLIYSFINNNSQSTVIDGDYQALLFIDYIYKELCKLNGGEKLSFGIATTRYANGSFDNSVKKYQDRLTILKGETGVANISRLVKNMDIGIFFEANGHGSIFFTNKAKSLFKEQKSDLVDFAAFFEYPVGDGFANLLAIEYILAKECITVDTWRKMYTPMVNVLVKMTVSDLSSYKLDPDNPSLLLTPVILRDFMVHLMKSKNCRIYIRPSGTEPCIRVYIESEEMSTVETVLKATEMKMKEINNN